MLSVNQIISFTRLLHYCIILLYHILFHYIQGFSIMVGRQCGCQRCTSSKVVSLGCVYINICWLGKYFSLIVWNMFLLILWAVQPSYYEIYLEQTCWCVCILKEDLAVRVRVRLCVWVWVWVWVCVCVWVWVCARVCVYACVPCRADFNKEHSSDHGGMARRNMYVVVMHII